MDIINIISLQKNGTKYCSPPSTKKNNNNDNNHNLHFLSRTVPIIQKHIVPKFRHTRHTKHTNKIPTQFNSAKVQGAWPREHNKKG